jgi:hypothetical protein
MARHTRARLLPVNSPLVNMLEGHTQMNAREPKPAASKKPILVSRNGNGEAVAPTTRRRRSPAYESGFADGYAAGYADGRKPNGSVIATTPCRVESKPSNSTSQQARLLGLPCPNCRLYLFSDETTCPRCHKQNEALMATS